MDTIEDLDNYLKDTNNSFKDGNFNLDFISKLRGVPSSVGIAAAITAYAQMMLYEFKNNPENKIFYSDTDSIVMEKEIDSNLVSNTKLGHLKLEHVISEGYFIADKFYAIINDKGVLIKKSKGINSNLLTLDDYNKLNFHITWFTPSGLKITQHYLVSKTNKISIKIGNKSKTVIIKESLDKLNTRKQAQAIIPNIIHSLDSSHLIKIVLSAIDNNFKPILTVHDCFGTHPNKIKELSEIVTKEFIELYSNDQFLQKFHKKIIESIKDNYYNVIKINNNYYVEFDNNKNNLVVIDTDTDSDIIKNKKKFNNKIELLLIPKLPKMGSLILEDIINSKYMIT